MEVNGYKVTIQDYDLWKDKILNLECRARTKAEEIIHLYQQTKQVGIVGADVVDNEWWEIMIFPDKKRIICKFYKNK